MLEVTKFWTRSFDLDRVDLFWEIANVPGPRSDADRHDVLEHEIFVLRAGDSPMGPYEQIGGPLVDQYFFRDVKVNLLHKWRQYFYKLRVVDRRTGEAKEFGPTSSGEDAPDLIGSEIQRQEDVLFREFVGRKGYLFISRTFGPRCSCFDVTLGRITRSNHRPCYGTGWLGGYMQPIEVFAQFDPNPKNVTHSSLPPQQASDTSARMISFPPVSPKDILVEADNRRWRVISVRSTQRLRAVVRQEIQLHEIPRGDIEYDLPVNVNEREMVAVADRNYTNPQNVESGKSYSDILSAYGHPSGTLR
jgi:hypothetical protein